jgi:hypothetical protein
MRIPPSPERIVAAVFDGFREEDPLRGKSATVTHRRYKWSNDRLTGGFMAVSPRKKPIRRGRSDEFEWLGKVN